MGNGDSMHYVLKGVGLGITMLQLLVNLMPCSLVDVDPLCGHLWAQFPSPVVASLIMLVLPCLACTGKMYEWTTAPSHPLVKNNVVWYGLLRCLTVWSGMVRYCSVQCSGARRELDVWGSRLSWRECPGKGGGALLW